MNETLAPERVLPLLRGSFGRPYRYFPSLESTQNAFENGDPEGAVAVAEVQTAGRGRLGRRWDAPAGMAILMSLLLRPLDAQLASQVSLVAGLAVAKAVEQATGGVASVKWPNDVLQHGCKVAGILAEGRGGDVQLGIGLNVNQPAEALPRDTRLPAASLRSHDGVERDRAPVLAELLLELELAYDRWRRNGLRALHDELVARDFLLGREVAVGDVSGIAGGIAPDGRLIVAQDGLEHRLASGEVRLV